MTPNSLVLAASGRARLQVEGQGYGYLRVSSERRWVWGEFDETFVVPLSKGKETLQVSVSGLVGRALQTIPCGPIIDLRSPPLVTRRPEVHTSVTLPRSRRLDVGRIPGPRPVKLQRATIQLSRQENETNS